MLPLIWRRIFRAARLPIGLLCALTQYNGAGHVLTAPVLVFAFYSAFALISAVWQDFEGPGFQTVGLALDMAVYFLALSSNLPDMCWLALGLGVYVMSRAVIEHVWWRSIVVAVLSVAVLNFSHSPQYFTLLPGVLTLGVLGSVAGVEHHLIKQRLQNALGQSVRHRYEAEKARESERQRIAADFHDGPLQSFISFQMRLELIRKLMARDLAAAEEELAQLQELCRGQIQELRAFVRSMRPVDVDGSLNGSLRRIIEQFQKDSGIPASFVSAEFVDPAEPEVSLELLQIVREALFNVQKHSGATRVAVGIHRTNGGIEISVEDNGNGFPFSGTYDLAELDLLRLGPGSIMRRVKTLKGDLLLESKPGQGSGLKIRIGE